MNRYSSAILRFFTVLLPFSMLHADVPLEDGIKSHLGKLTADNMPGIAVLVARDGKIVDQGGFGWADIGKKLR